MSSKRFYSIYMLIISLITVFIYSIYLETKSEEITVIAELDTRYYMASLSYSDEDLTFIKSKGGYYGDITRFNKQKFDVTKNIDEDLYGNVEVTLKLYDGRFYIENLNLIGTLSPKNNDVLNNDYYNAEENEKQLNEHMELRERISFLKQGYSSTSYYLKNINANMVETIDEDNPNIRRINQQISPYNIIAVFDLSINKKEPIYYELANSFQFKVNSSSLEENLQKLISEGHLLKQVTSDDTEFVITEIYKSKTSNDYFVKYKKFGKTITPYKALVKNYKDDGVTAEADVRTVIGIYSDITLFADKEILHSTLANIKDYYKNNVDSRPTSKDYVTDTIPTSWEKIY